MNIKKYAKQKDSDQLLSKLRSYSLLAGGLLAGLSQVDAGVVYTDVDPDDFINGFGSFNIDFDGDGTIDVHVQHSSSYYMTSNINSYRYQLYAFGASSGNKVLGNYGSARQLSQGDTISAGKNFTSYGYMAGFRYVGMSGTPSTISYSGSWLDFNQDRYLGVEFVISGQTHYGWVRMTVDFQVSGATLHDFAYESDPNTAIIAGDSIFSATCSVPNNIGFTAFTYNSVTYAWDTVGTATGYEIRGGLNPTGPPYVMLPINNPAQSSFQINKLNPGSIYGISIRTLCGADTSSWSNEIVFQPPACDAPVSTFVTNLTASSVKLNWSLVPGPYTPAGYNILGRAVGSSAITSLTVPHPTNTFQVNNLPSGVAFEWAVVTVCTPNGAVRSGFSPVNTFSTLGNAEKLAGLDQISPVKKMKIAPHPINGISIIQFDNAEGSNYQLTLTDMNGKLVRTTNNINTNMLSIEKGNLSAGMYILELKGKDYFVEKVIID